MDCQSAVRRGIARRVESEDLVHVKRRWELEGS